MNNQRGYIDAIVNGDDETLVALLEADADGETLSATIDDDRPTNHAIGRGMTLLQLAAIRERKEGKPATILIQRGAEVDLHSACGLGMNEKVAALLAEDPDALNHQIDTYFPLQFAITAARPATIQCLAQQGDDVNRDLRKVAYFGWEDDAIDQNYTPWKPIHMASLWGFNATRVPVAQALASAGADLNAVSPLDGFRPIHLVAMPNRVDMIKFFVSQGVDVDSRTESCPGIDLPDEKGPLSGFGCTALMVAAAEGFVEASACLLELGADPNAKNDQGHTAMDFAKKRFWDGQPYDKVIELLGNA